MQHLTNYALPQVEPKVGIWYVDNIIKKGQVEKIHEIINNIFKEIIFTREEENDKTLAFLAILISR